MKRSALLLSWFLTSTLVAGIAIPSAGLHSVQARTETPSPISQSQANEIDEFVEQLIASRQIPGLSLAIIQDGKLIKAKGYGLLNRELQVHTRTNSIFPIASVSKPFTATAIMLLVQEGKVSLDAPISHYLADTPAHWNNITVRHLLTHTAGLSEAVYNRNMRSLTKLAQFQKQASKLPLDFEPGEAWSYSNTGYNLAALIIENVSGQPFANFMSNRIFQPLDLNSTDAIRENYRFSNFATGYYISKNQLKPHPENRLMKPNLVPIVYGSGSMTSTVLDLAKWEIALQKGELLDPALQAEMQQPVVMNSDRQFGYGLGWQISTSNGHRIVSHGGNIGGYSTSISRFPNDNLTVILLTNKEDESGDTLAKKIAQQHIPSLQLDKTAPMIADSNPLLSENLLRYVNGDDAAIEQTSEWEIMLSTPRGQWAESSFRQAGRGIETLELIKQEAHPNGTRYYYRAKMAAGDRILSAVITPENTLAAVGLSAE